jgi:hypothetical protein
MKRTEVVDEIPDPTCRPIEVMNEMEAHADEVNYVDNHPPQQEHLVHPIVVVAVPGI